jgi:hypothetical protein
VHEQVDDRARQEKQVRQRAENVRTVLFPQEKGRDGQEGADA